MLGVVMALLAAAGFGTAAVFARLALQHMRATTGTLLSLIVGTTIVMTLALLIHWEAVFALTGVAFLWFLLSGSINFPVGRLLNFTGVRLAGVSRSSPIVGSSPMFAIALAVTVGGESVNAPILAGTAAILGGLVLILTQR